MKKTQKRAYILSECKSPYIQQAIFILKDGIDSDSSGVIADAERIVSSYMGNPRYIEQKKSPLKPPLLLITMLLGLGAVCIGTLLFYMI